MTYYVSFKCPGGGTVAFHDVPGTDGHEARRRAIHQAITGGFSRQVGHWASTVRSM